MLQRGKAFRAAIPLVLALVACGQGGGTASIEGTWTIASATVGGKDVAVAAFQGSPLMLSGGKYIFQNDTGEYTLTPGTPAALEVRGLQGPNAGRVIPAIVKVEHDTLVICYDLSGTAAPKAFVSEEGTQQFLARFARAP